MLLNKELNVDIPIKVLTILKPSSIRQKLFSIFYDLENALFVTPEGSNIPNPILSLSLLFGKFGFKIKDILVLLRYALRIIFPSFKYIRYRYELPESKITIFYWYFFRMRAFLVRFLKLGKSIERGVLSNRKQDSLSS